MEPEATAEDKRLGPIPITPDTSELLSELQAKVRQAGHRKPTQSTLVSALIHGASRDGRQLELEVIAPYRQAHPDIDTQA